MGRGIVVATTLALFVWTGSFGDLISQCPLSNVSGSPDYVIQLDGDAKFIVSTNGTCTCQGTAIFNGGIGGANGTTVVNGDLVVRGNIVNGNISELRNAVAAQAAVITNQSAVIAEQQRMIEELRQGITEFAQGYGSRLSMLASNCCSTPLETIYGWGLNNFGQVGDNSNGTSRGAPTITQRPASWSGKTVVALSAGGLFSMALLSDNSLHAWGRNSNYQLGDGTRLDRLVPTPVQRNGSFAGARISAVAAGGLHTLAIADGHVWAWGANEDFQCGTNQTIPAVRLPTPVSEAWKNQDWSLNRSATAVAAGGMHSLVLLDDGSVYAWGRNEFGQLGNGQNLSVAVPVQVPLNGRARAVAAGYLHSVALSVNGSVFAWGWNQYWQVGDGTRDHRWLPTAVNSSWGPAERVVSIASGANHVLALLSSGQLWSWGRNGEGSLGINTTSPRAVPVRVVTPVSWTIAAISAGAHSLALLDDGSLYAWGLNQDGQTGTGPSVNGSLLVPTLVRGPLSWIGQRARMIAAGTNHSLALLS